MTPVALALLFVASLSTPDSRIARVTVFPAGAEVVREVTVRVPAGPSQVTLDGIPVDVDPESIRVSGRGAPAVLGTLDSNLEESPGQASPDFAPAEAEIRRIESELAALRLEEQTDAELRAYVDALRPPAPHELSGRPQSPPLAPEEHARMVAFLHTSYSELASRALDRSGRKQTLDANLTSAHARRAAAAPRGATRARRVSLDIDSAAGGTLTLSLAYTVPGARWRPVYRATLGSTRDEVEFVSEAMVSQRTGEDWSDVALTLSTSVPTRGLESPVLESRILADMASASSYISTAGGNPNQVGYGPKGGNINAFSGSLVDIAAALVAEDEESGLFRASILQHDINAAFAVPGATDIPSDEATHRVTLTRETLPALFAYRVVPSVARSAYALAITKAPEDRLLLAGNVRVVSGISLLGEFQLAQVAPGAEFRVPLGIDARLDVQRIKLPPAAESRRASKSDDQQHFGYRTTIVNTRDVPVELVIEERIPESQDQRIVVQVDDDTTPGFERIEGRPGILNWRMTLEPKERREVELRYSVRFPKGLAVAGL